MTEMEYNVVEDRMSPDTWHVETINYTGDGEKECL